MIEKNIRVHECSYTNIYVLLVMVFVEHLCFFSANGDKKPQQKLFNFVYLPHPRAVTALSWRHTSKYMPRGFVANMLVTSCKDNICRLWSQTLLPEDGLINLSQIEALANLQPKVQRHKNKIMSKLKHIKSLSEHKTKTGSGYPAGAAAGANGSTGAVSNGVPPVGTMPSLPSSFSINDFHNFALQGSGVAPGVHFHLAASINAESGMFMIYVVYVFFSLLYLRHQPIVQSTYAPTS